MVEGEESRVEGQKRLLALDPRLSTHGRYSECTRWNYCRKRWRPRGVGYDVRQDWLGGDGGGHCLVRGRRLILLDVAQTPDEQLDVVVEALRGEVGAASLKISPKLTERLQVRAAA